MKSISRAINLPVRVAVTVAAIGSITFVFCSVASLIGATLTEARDRQSDQTIVQKLNNDPSGPSIDAAIARRTQLITYLKSKSFAEDQKHKLAYLYERKGKLCLERGHDLQAEESFQTASDLDPKNPQFVGDMASLYEAAATSQPEMEPRLQLMRSSSQYYQDAMARGASDARRVEYSSRAARTSYALAKEEFKDPELRSHGEADLAQAQMLAPAGTQLAKHIENFLRAEN
jgi:hypothetical protein